MKTETEKLKENSDKQLFKERMDELSVYMNKLMKTINKQHSLMMRSYTLEVSSLMTYFITLFFANSIISDVSFMLWLFVILRGWASIQPKLIRASAELCGCFTTLEKLGMLDKKEGGNHRRRVKIADFMIKQELSEKCKNVMIKDVEGCNDYGDECDKKSWMRLLAHLKKDEK